MEKGRQYAVLKEFSVSRRHIESCTFSKWYPIFRKHVPTSRIIKPLPKEFIEYLEQDGIKLPKSEQTRSIYTEDIVRNEENEYSDWEEEEEAAQTTEIIDPLTHFPELHNKIEDIIRDLGSVTPKLNWSAPRDATWILPNNTLKCNEINDVYLLLNASNYIMHDLQHAFRECVDSEKIERPEYELVLRQWFDINPALEFRVFIRDGRIIGASQRDLNYYNYLEPLTNDFKDLIDEFVDEIILPNFSEKSCVLDIYIPRPYDKIFLIDINPFARMTDPLLFSWNELLTKKMEMDQDYELRIVPENNVARFAAKEHSENQVPKDIVDASLDSEMIKELAKKWQELATRQEKEDEDEEESDDS